VQTGRGTISRRVDDFEKQANSFESWGPRSGRATWNDRGESNWDTAPIGSLPSRSDATAHLHRRSSWRSASR
jgi:hypothetical protein